MLCVVHSVSNTVGNNDVSGKFERLNVPLCLLKRTLHTCAQALGLDDEVAVLRNPRQGPEYSYIDAPPLALRSRSGGQPSARRNGTTKCAISSSSLAASPKA